VRVVVTHEFVGVLDGQVYGRPILVGEVLTGDLAQLALREGWAKMAEAANPAPKPAKPPRPAKAEAEAEAEPVSEGESPV
jgi:hypothetical protein